VFIAPNTLDCACLITQRRGILSAKSNKRLIALLEQNATLLMVRLRKP
jgi:hypothetical protein